MAENKNELKVAKGLMDKLDIEYTDKINSKRALTKLKNFLAKEGMDEDLDLSKEEIALIKEMGFDIEGDEEEDDEVEEGDEEEEEDEEEDEEEPQPKKAKKSEPKKSEPKAAKKSEPKAKKGIDRIQAACQILKKKKNHKIEEFIEASNKLYADQGGKDNVKEAAFTCRYVIRVLDAMEALSVKDDSIKMA